MTRFGWEQIVPLLLLQRGFRGYYLLADRQSGKLIGPAFWETKEDMAASEDVAAQNRAQASAAVSVTVPFKAERYEVLVEEYA